MKKVNARADQLLAGKLMNFNDHISSIKVHFAPPPLVPNPLADRYILAVHSGKCLDVAMASGDNGGNVHQYDCHGGSNQKWEFVPDRGG